ncbi:hypothetical protein NP511_06670 [Natrinema thermotolerans]|uniref:Uncharacterized protein n=1 Tax=Natrinema thermotolerans TaxID=121872 RepID=A0AAF0T2J7_9EURY|nr:hypothetical protein [Natrinema thermotolerans]QCC58204.1 hypothetical protein DVR14_05950 [Natrinema thermotolerans]WMT09315.1 hypothetical protein NP511_06670 [Natrinema thermotolerans]
MLDEAAELVLELGVDWLIDRNGTRSRLEQASLFLGLVAAVTAAALAVLVGPLYGLAVGVVALVLLLYGA